METKTMKRRKVSKSNLTEERLEQRFGLVSKGFVERLVNHGYIVFNDGQKDPCFAAIELILVGTEYLKKFAPKAEARKLLAVALSRVSTAYFECGKKN